MQRFTLADASRLHSANGVRNRDCQIVENLNDPVIVDGVLDNEGLTVSLHSPNSGAILSERTCIRFDNRELCITSDIPSHTHEHCDVLEGKTNEGLGVAIESHRCYTADPQDNAPALKRFHRQALICSGLSHVNIVPFLGILSSNKFPCACVFKSIGKESLPKYLISNPRASRLKLLKEVARGLHHIHDLDIIHGGIKGANIRVDDEGTARIAGFASAVFLAEAETMSDDGDLSLEINLSRWCSPEILHPGSAGLTKAKVTKASDIYAFGMLAYEIFSGRVPFYGRHDAAVAVTVIATSERPPRPVHCQLSDQLWEMIEKCWRTDPSQRPTIGEIVMFLEKRWPLID